MKTKHYFLIGALGFAMAGAIFTGCKKDTTTTTTTATTPTDYTAAEDNANASSVVNDSKGISDNAAQGKSTERTLSTCATVLKRDTNSKLDSLLDINFGSTDCLCSDGRLRRGHILVWYQPKNYFTLGDSVVMSFKNYYVNDIGVTGVRRLTNTSSTTFHFTASLSLTYPLGGGTATWNSTRTDSIKTIASVTYVSVTGGANGVSRKGTSYNITITSPVYVTALPPFLGGCPYFEAGNITVALPTYNIALKYGKGVGTCSDTATATISAGTTTYGTYGFRQM